MKCEYYGKILLDREVTNGLRYGQSDVFHDAFMPARDSAWSVICSACGEFVFELIYSKLPESDQEAD